MIKCTIALLTFLSASLYAWEQRPIDFNETVVKIWIRGHRYYVTQAWHDPECYCAIEHVEEEADVEDEAM